MRFLPVFLVASFFLILYGCIQVSPPQQCASLNASEQAGCIYSEAVLAQSPYDCYAISDLAQRQTCLSDAIDPSAQKKLQRIVNTGGTPTIGSITNGSNLRPIIANANAASTQNATAQEQQPPAPAPSEAQQNATAAPSQGTNQPAQPSPTDNQSVQNQAAPTQSSPPSIPTSGQGLAAG